MKNAKTSSRKVKFESVNHYKEVKMRRTARTDLIKGAASRAIDSFGGTRNLKSRTLRNPAPKDLLK